LGEIKVENKPALGIKVASKGHKTSIYSLTKKVD